MQTTDPTTTFRMIRDAQARQIRNATREREAQSGRKAQSARKAPAASTAFGRIVVTLRSLTVAHA